eukprot:scaffold13326_cov127-Isochrysis_galbana.AAC.3
MIKVPVPAKAKRRDESAMHADTYAPGIGSSLQQRSSPAAGARVENSTLTANAVQRATSTLPMRALRIALPYY